MLCNFQNISEIFGDALLPIIPAGAKLSKRSTLSEEHIGKIPGKYNKQYGTWAGFAEWPRFKAEMRDYMEWDTWPDVLVGLNLQEYVGIDIDIEDEELSEHILEILYDVLPPSIIRVREDSARKMLIYGIGNVQESDLASTDRVSFFTYGMVEFLGPGRQAVLCGRHPKGGMQTFSGELKIIDSELIKVAIERLYSAFPDINDAEVEPGREKLPRVQRSTAGNRSTQMMIATIMGWEQNGRHDAIRDLSYGLIRDGVAPLTTYQLMYAVLHSVPAAQRDKVWEKYLADLPRTIDGATKLSDTDSYDDKCDFDKVKPFTDTIAPFPKPIGRLAELTRAVWNASPHPNIVVSTTTALALVAGVAGRRFNWNGDGVNLYISLLMESGMGKDIISQFITFVLLRNAGRTDYLNASAFMGAKRFTGPKSLQNLLEKKRSNVCVFNEAGFMYGSSAGDGVGLQRIILDLFTKSGATGTTAAEEYSDSENSTEVLYSPALTIVNESTPSTFLNVMSKRRAEESGEFGRMLLFRVAEKKSYFNRHKKLDLEDELYEKLANLIQFCLETQEDDNPLPVILRSENEDRMYKLSEHYTDLYNETREEDPLRATTYSRAFQKICRLAAVSAIIDHDGPYEKLVVGKKHIDWAIQVIEFEQSCVGVFSQGGTESPIEDIVKHHVAPVLHKLFNLHYKERKLNMTAERAKERVFSFAELRRLLHNNTVIKEWSTRAGRGAPAVSGVRKMIDFMLSEGYIVTFDGTIRWPRHKELYQCTKEMNFLFQEQETNKIVEKVAKRKR